MHIQTIKASERDSEVCISCPNPGCPVNGCRVDPRSCELFWQCPNCGPQMPTGDIEWLDYLSGELTLKEMRAKIKKRRDDDVLATGL